MNSEEISSAFWSTLALLLAQEKMQPDQRFSALQWLAQEAGSPDRIAYQRPVVRALENGVLDALLHLSKRGAAIEDARPFLYRLATPLFHDPLLAATSDVFRRMLGHLLRLGDSGLTTKIYAGTITDSGDRFEMQVPEREELNAALEGLRKLVEGQDAGGAEVDPQSATIRAHLTKDIPNTAHNTRIDVEFPLEELVLLDDDHLRAHIVDLVLSHASAVDPRFGDRIATLAPSLVGDDPLARREAIRSFVLAYLESTYFDLRRDLAHAVFRLSRAELRDIDILCTGSTPFPAALNPADPIRALLDGMNDGLQISSMHSLMFLRLHAGDVTPDLAQGLLEQIDRQFAGTTRAAVFAALAENSFRVPNIFESLWQFTLLLLTGYSEPEQPLRFGDTEITLANCVERFLVRMLSPGQTPASEIERRQIHAYLLQLGTWVAGSQFHSRELWTRLGDNDQVVIGWTLRGILLADRMQPIAGRRLGSVSSRSADLQSVVEGLHINIDAELYPDVFNPFLCGPTAYDHAQAGLLATLHSSWRLLAGEETGARPFWWSTDVEKAISDMACRPENAAEEQFRIGCERGKPNRLKVSLDRTPQQFARELLTLAGL